MIVCGAAPQAKRIIPLLLASAELSAASVQLPGVPLPTTVAPLVSTSETGRVQISGGATSGAVADQPTAAPDSKASEKIAG